MPQRQSIGVVFWTLGLVLASGCGSSNGSKSGSGGASAPGGASGSGGATGTGGTTSTGGAPVFTAVTPCNAATDYATVADNTINFGMMGADFVYMPKCLKVTAGATVTFKGFGIETFSNHPLAPSDKIGTVAGNPITETAEPSNTKTFTFPTAGAYAFFCEFHGSDLGDAMAGVIWVQ